MGYTTDFEGQISLSRALTEEQAHYITQFSQSRRMGRNASICQEFDDPVRESVGLPIGTEGNFVCLTMEVMIDLLLITINPLQHNPASGVNGFQLPT